MGGTIRPTYLMCLECGGMFCTRCGTKADVSSPPFHSGLTSNRVCIRDATRLRQFDTHCHGGLTIFLDVAEEKLLYFISMGKYVHMGVVPFSLYMKGSNGIGPIDQMRLQKLRKRLISSKPMDKKWRL
eukprot:gnl/Chilomastix_caulleri/2050.p2 GENE.gnl/Chilomastix_caulleri/2050~~gnl/Chilomastix_caulleri/2050.p2  ORF type:complete len:128 (+),score=21.59 gnl/Chilomastix_caulleri/2050:562-945(+)